MREIQFHFPESVLTSNSESNSEGEAARCLKHEAVNETETIACEIVNVHLTHLFQMMVKFQLGQISREEFQAHLQTHASGMDEANEILQSAAGAKDSAQPSPATSSLPFSLTA